MTKEQELRLISAAQKGDEGAFEALVLENQKAVYNLTLQLTKNPEDALDVSQETFIKAYMNLDAFRGDSRFSVWLYRLAHNAAIDLLRKKHRKAEVSLTSDDEEEEVQFDIPDDRPQPEEVLERRETRKAVREAISALSEDKREILMMREFSGMSYTDIALALNISEGTVKSRISRARLSLMQLLEKKGTFLPPDTSKKKGGPGNE